MLAVCPNSSGSQSVGTHVCSDQIMGIEHDTIESPIDPADQFVVELFQGESSNPLRQSTWTGQDEQTQRETV